MATVDKIPLKQCYTWVLGLQTERNEAKHVLDQLSRSNPKPQEIQNLGVGEFFISIPRKTVKFYAQPGWMNEDQARQIATHPEEPKRKELHAPVERHPALNELITSPPVDRRPAEMTLVARGLGDKTTEERSVQGRATPTPQLLSEVPAKLVNQSLPTIEIHQFKPTLKLELPEYLSEPLTPLGKVCVVLKTVAPGGKNDRWSVRVIEEKLKDHGWDASGLEDIVDQLKHWEILSVKSNGMLRCDTKRIVIVDKGTTVPVS
jgi:hypothetical protein